MPSFQESHQDAKTYLGKGVFCTFPYLYLYAIVPEIVPKIPAQYVAKCHLSQNVKMFTEFYWKTRQVPMYPALTTPAWSIMDCWPCSNARSNPRIIHKIYLHKATFGGHFPMSNGECI